MRFIIFILTVAVFPSFAIESDEDKYCNGQRVEFAGDLYYPNGQRVKYAGDFYYPNGQRLEYAGNLYYPNGQRVKYADDFYYPNGQRVKYAGDFYYPNGQRVKYAGDFYYPNGQRLEYAGDLYYPNGQKVNPSESGNIRIFGRTQDLLFSGTLDVLSKQLKSMRYRLKIDNKLDITFSIDFTHEVVAPSDFRFNFIQDRYRTLFRVLSLQNEPIIIEDINAKCDY